VQLAVTNRQSRRRHRRRPPQPRRGRAFVVARGHGRAASQRRGRSRRAGQVALPAPLVLRPRALQRRPRSRATHDRGRPRIHDGPASAPAASRWRRGVDLFYPQPSALPVAPARAADNVVRRGVRRRAPRRGCRARTRSTTSHAGDPDLTLGEYGRCLRGPTADLVLRTSPGGVRHDRVAMIGVPIAYYMARDTRGAVSGPVLTRVMLPMGASTSLNGICVDDDPVQGRYHAGWSIGSAARRGDGSDHAYVGGSSLSTSNLGRFWCSPTRGCRS